MIVITTAKTASVYPEIRSGVLSRLRMTSTCVRLARRAGWASRTRRCWPETPGPRPVVTAVLRGTRELLTFLTRRGPVSVIVLVPDAGG